MKNKLLKTIYLVLTAVLITLAVWLRNTSSNFFYDLVTFPYEGNYLAHDTANVAALIWAHFKNFFRMYLRQYLLPVYLLIIPSAILGGIAFAPRQEEKIESKQKSNFLDRRFVFITAAATLILILVIHFRVLKGIPRVSDEFSYVFQSKILSSGKLYAESPPLPRYFRSDNIISDGKWYSKYTIGWPLILAVGQLLRVEFLVNPLIASFSIIFIFLISRELFGKNGAILASFLAVLSPYFVFTASSYFPHTAVGLFTLILFYCLLNMQNDNSFIYPIAAGISILALILIRPADGGVIFLGVIPMLLYVVYDSGWKRRKIIGAGVILLSLAAGIAILLVVNKAQTGDPFLFAFTKFNQEDRWGMGAMNHSFILGLWHLAFATMRNGIWSVPLIGFFAFLCLFKKDIKVYLILIPSLGLVVFYFFFFSLGAQNFGIRYYYPVFVTLAVVAPGGVDIFKGWLEKILKCNTNRFTASLMIVLTIFMIFGVYPNLTTYLEQEYSKFNQLLEWMKDPPGTDGKSLIFLQNDPGKNIHTFTRNIWDYWNQENLRAIFLLPEKNRQLIKKFPHRKPYLVRYDFSKKWFTVRPYPENDKTTRSYVFAGINYKKALLDPARAQVAFKKALLMEPQNPSVLFNLGYLYFETEKYKEAEKIFRKIIAVAPSYSSAYYYLGRSLGEMGRTREAINVLRKFVENFPQSYLKDRALDWLLYYHSLVVTYK